MASGWLSTKSAAHILGVTPRLLYLFIDDSALPAYRTGKLIRLRRAEVEDFLVRRADEIQRRCGEQRLALEPLIAYRFTLVVEGEAGAVDAGVVKEKLLEAGCGEAVVVVVQGTCQARVVRSAAGGFDIAVAWPIRVVESVAGVRVIRVERDG